MLHRSKKGWLSMYDDIDEFRKFYQTGFGTRVSGMIQQQLGSFWEGGPSLMSACLGYGIPVFDEKTKIFSLMPSRFGALAGQSSVCSCLVDSDMLPIPDVHLDRLLLMHSLEFQHDVGRLLDECWRVLDGAGRLMVVVPNRTGLWARTETTPFGHGQPFSGYQIQKLLKSHGFEPRQTSCAVFIPPLAGQFFQQFTQAIERVGARLWPAIGGVLLVEADKILYAASSKRQKRRQRAITGRRVLVGET